MNEIGPDGWIRADKPHTPSGVIKEIRNRIEALEMKVLPERGDVKRRISSLCRQLSAALNELDETVEVRHETYDLSRLGHESRAVHAVNVVVRGKEEVL